MSVEIIFTKRKARIGEMGLFLDTDVFRDEFSSLPIGAEVKAECTVPSNLKYLKFFWALVDKVAENSPDGFLDKRDCADRVLLEAKHFKLVHDPIRNKAELRIKSVSGLSADTWIRLLRRVTHVVVTKFMLGMDQNALTAEIEAMVGFSTPEPPKRRKTKKSLAEGQSNRKEVVGSPDTQGTGQEKPIHVAPADSSAAGGSAGRHITG